MSHLLHTLRLLWQALRRFQANQGILLAGAIAYYTLLSIIPLFTLLLVALSHLIDEHKLLSIVYSNLYPIFGTQTNAITDQMEAFLQNRQTVSWVGLAGLLFFSSTAFTVLERAMAVIFSHRGKIHRRHFLISAAIPYAYILILGLGILFITIISGILELFAGQTVAILGWSVEFDQVTGNILYLIGLVSLILLLASLYRVMPVGGIAFRHALIGGLCATVLWEIARRALVWYLSNLSMVNVIYGSLATAVIALLFLEVAAIILLLGAQVIAEYERSPQDKSAPTKA